MAVWPSSVKNTAPAGEMAPRVRTAAAKPAHLSSSPQSHTVEEETNSRKLPSNLGVYAWTKWISGVKVKKRKHSTRGQRAGSVVKNTRTALAEGQDAIPSTHIKWLRVVYNSGSMEIRRLWTQGPFIHIYIDTHRHLI